MAMHLFIQALQLCFSIPLLLSGSSVNHTCTSGRALVPLASMDRSSLYDIHDVHA